MLKTALILGGGFAGLAAAIHLARQGVAVTLLEQQPTLGGKAGRFAKDGFHFDTGPSVFTMRWVLDDLFREAGRELPVVFEPLEPLCRYLYPSGRVWDVYQDVERTTAQLGPKEAKVYRALLNEAKRLYEAAAPTFIESVPPGLLALARYGLRHGLRAHPQRTLPQLLESFGASPDLTQFFLRFATYFGANPYRAPAILHNIAWAELGLGVYYPQGGIRAIVDALGELAKDLGVNIQTGVTVTNLEPTASRVTHIHTSKGSFQSETVVSSLDIVRTHQLLGKTTRLSRLEPSLSGFVLLLGLQGHTPDLSHHTISFSKDYRAEFGAIARGQSIPDPTLYFNLSCRSESSDSPAGHENWFVMANAPALSGTQNNLDEEAYAQQMLEVLEARGFRVKTRLKMQHVLGPKHLATFAERGSIYGHAPHSLFTTLRPQQRIAGLANLILAGGTVYPGGGMPLALLSGKAAARQLLSSVQREG
ncbi:MAG: phytoene desaturase family protein [Trueperaceae bacterium]